MPPRLFWLLVLPIVALQPALSQAAGQKVAFNAPSMDAEIRQAGDLAHQAAAALERSLDVLRSVLPDYGAPYIDRHGDIVIPRLRHPVRPADGGTTAA